MKELKNLRIERIALHGYGIAHASGKTIFIPHTAPGDVVDIALNHQKKDISFGEVKRYVKRAEGIITPPCEAFGPPAFCGGCDWLMAPYPLQLEWKNTLLKGVFEPFVPHDVIKPVIASPKTDFYRNKAFFPVSSKKGRLFHGIFRSWTHDVVQHKSCHIQNPVFDRIAHKVLELAQKAGIQAYQELKHLGNLRQIGMRASRDGSEIVLVLVSKSARLPFTQLLVKQLTHEFPQIVGIVQNIQRDRTNVILGREDRLLWGKPYIVEKVRGLSLRVHYRSFLQVNTDVYELILEKMAARLKPGSSFIDAYSGIGSIAMALAKGAKSALCIEEVPEAIEDARQNAADNGITNLSFECARVERVLATRLKKHYDSIILDPPRSGLAEGLPGIIAAARIPQVLYLSCNPMTLARDLRAFFGAHYRLVELQPFDMFPQTWHIECLAVLEREG